MPATISPRIAGGRRFVVIGGGIAGLATAHFLSRRSGTSVVLITGKGHADGQRSGPPHATGRSAEIFRPAADDAIVRGLARETREMYLAPRSAGLSAGLETLDSIGLFIATAAKCPPWRRDLESAGLARFGAAEELARRAPYFDPAGEHVAWLPGAGRVRVRELASELARTIVLNGVQVLRGTMVAGIETAGQRVRGVGLEHGDSIEASDVVIAAGAWSGALGASIDARLPLRPTLRHMVVFQRTADPEETPPVVWDDAARFYVRAQGCEWWTSACDTVDVGESPSGEYDVDDDTVRRAEALFRTHVAVEPRPEVVRAWSGYRDLTPDDRPVLGPDGRIDGLHWCAGLGGHGMTIGLAAARAAAELAVGRSSRLGAGCLATRFGSGI